jgi:hypothetical protein
MQTEEYTHCPSPWTLKGDVYMFAFWTSSAQAKDLPSLTYSPLEGGSTFANPDGSRPLGGLSMVQIIRYTESPVGPYDEMMVIPGFHSYVVEENGRRVKKKNIRVTRIYVSQKYTCWNGRRSKLQKIFINSDSCCRPPSS